MTTNGKFLFSSKEALSVKLSSKTVETWPAPLYPFRESTRSILSDERKSTLLKRELSATELSSVGEAERHLTWVFSERFIQSKRQMWRKSASRRRLAMGMTMDELRKIPENPFVRFQGISAYWLNHFWMEILEEKRFPDVSLFTCKDNGETITVAWNREEMARSSEKMFAVCFLVDPNLKRIKKLVNPKVLEFKPRDQWTVGDVTDFCILPSCLKQNKKAVNQKHYSDIPRVSTSQKPYGFNSKLLRTSAKRHYSHRANHKSNLVEADLIMRPTSVGAASRGSANLKKKYNINCFLNGFENFNVGRRFQGAYLIHTRAMTFQELVDVSKEYVKELGIRSSEVYLFLKFMAIDYNFLQKTLCSNNKNLINSYQDFCARGLHQGMDAFQDRIIVLDECGRFLKEASALWECYGALSKKKRPVMMISSKDTGKVIQEATTTDILFNVIDKLDPGQIKSSVSRDKDMLEAIMKEIGGGFKHIQDILSTGFTRMLQEEITSHEQDMFSATESPIDRGPFCLYIAQFYFRRKIFDKAFEYYQKTEEYLMKIGVEEYFRVVARDPLAESNEEYQIFNQNKALVATTVEGLAEARLGCAKILVDFETTNLGYEKIFKLLKKVDFVVQQHEMKKDFKHRANLVRADLLSKMGQHSEALNYYQTVDLDWKIMPNKLSEALIIASKISDEYLKKKQDKQAFLTLKRALVRLNNADDDIVKADLLKKLGDLFLKFEKFTEAEKVYHKAKEIVEKSIGKWNVRRGNIYYKSAECLLRQGDYKGALKEAVQMRVIFSKVFGNVSLKYSNCNYFLGCIFVYKCDNHDKSTEEKMRSLKLASTKFKNALETARQVTQQDKIKKKFLAIAQYALALAQTHQRLDSPVEEYKHFLVEALEIRERECGSNNPLTVEVKAIMKRTSGSYLYEKPTLEV